jgi:hypothetical protein
MARARQGKIVSIIETDQPTIVQKRKTAVRTLRHFRTAARHGPKAAIKSVPPLLGHPTVFASRPSGQWVIDVFRRFS